MRVGAGLPPLEMHWRRAVLSSLTSSLGPEVNRGASGRETTFNIAYEDLKHGRDVLLFLMEPLTLKVCEDLLSGARFDCLKSESDVESLCTL